MAVASFSPSDAAFTGFRVVRERPTVVLFLIVMQLLLGLAFTLIFIGLFGPALGQIQTMALSGSNDPAQSIRALQMIGPLYLVLIPLSLAFYAIVCAAMNRAVLRPSESAFGYLRLGADELRQAGVLFLTWLVLIGVYIGSIIASIIFSMIMAGLVAVVAKGAMAFATVLISLVVVAGVIVPVIFVATRLSLASAQTFATGKVNLFGSWSLTQGRFWPVFGTYALAMMLLILMALLAAIITGVAMYALGGGMAGLNAMMTPNMSSLSGYFTVGRVVYFIMSGAFTGLFLPVWLTPPAAIYQSLTAGRDARTVEALFA